LLVNLLSNAIKNTSRGRIDVSAERQMRDGEAWVVLSVRDTGAGIPDDIAGQLGNAFALNEGVVDSLVIRGVGLGLAICKGIATAHGGKVSFVTNAGHGSTFTAHLRADLPGPIDFVEETELLREAAA
jgi:signal transduction histidine kinase